MSNFITETVILQNFLVNWLRAVPGAPAGDAYSPVRFARLILMNRLSSPGKDEQSRTSRPRMRKFLRQAAALSIAGTLRRIKFAGAGKVSTPGMIRRAERRRSRSLSMSRSVFLVCLQSFNAAMAACSAGMFTVQGSWPLRERRWWSSLGKRIADPETGHAEERAEGPEHRSSWTTALPL